MPDVMIDLETLSINPSAVILTIGAVKFNRRGNINSLNNKNSFYRRIVIKAVWIKD